MVPTYNEKENIRPLVDEIFRAAGPSTMIIIVDDSSPDGTGEAADEIAKKRKGVLVIHRTERGRGSAGIRGFQEALKYRPDYVIEMDADFSHDPSYIPAFLREIRDCDIVIGSRMVGGGATVERGFVRNAITSFAGLVTRMILGMRVMDIQSGYKCYRTNVLESMDFARFVSKGYSIGAETLYRAHRKGFYMKEMPIIFRNRKKGKSKLSVQEMFSFFFNVLRIRLGA